MSTAEKPLVIVGPTASGKSTLALELARKLGNAEIISVDAMQVYSNMNIGTDTPTEVEQAEILHHMINLVEPSQEFTVAQFQAKALAALNDIRKRSRIPVLAGGSGLHMRAIVDSFNIPSRYPQVREQLETEPDTSTLYKRLIEVDPLAASRIDSSNRRRIIRALEVSLGSGKAFSSYGPGLNSYPPTSFVIVGLRWSLSALDERIAVRLEKQIADGFLEEVRMLQDQKMSRTASRAIGYRSLLAHLRGEISLNEALRSILIRSRQFARRQIRWFKRDPRIIWLDAPVNVSELLDTWKANQS